MTFLITTPDIITGAATDLGGIGSTLAVANSAPSGLNATSHIWLVCPARARTRRPLATPHNRTA